MENLTTEEQLQEQKISSKIHLLRGQKVMLDSDLADLYGVQTKRLNEQLKRNSNRFPSDFMFQLTEEEYESLRSQIATSNRGGRRYLPYAFTEHGILMLSSVLNSEIAIQVNIKIMRVYVKLRELILSHKDILLKLEQMEKQMKAHGDDIQTIFIALEQLLNPPKEDRIPIGYKFASKD